MEIAYPMRADEITRSAGESLGGPSAVGRWDPEDAEKEQSEAWAGGGCICCGPGTLA